MAPRAYMLVETESDAAPFVEAARRMEGVAAADALFGDLDAIVVIEAATLEALEKAVARVHGAPGLLSADTRIARTV